VTSPQEERNRGIKEPASSFVLCQEEIQARPHCAPLLLWTPLCHRWTQPSWGSDSQRAKELPAHCFHGHLRDRAGRHAQAAGGLSFKEANDFGSEVIPGACAQGMKVRGSAATGASTLHLERNEMLDL